MEVILVKIYFMLSGSHLDMFERVLLSRIRSYKVKIQFSGKNAGPCVPGVQGCVAVSETFSSHSGQKDFLASQWSYGCVILLFHSTSWLVKQGIPFFPRTGNTNVLKTGPDRPVQSVGPVSGRVASFFNPNFVGSFFHCFEQVGFSCFWPVFLVQPVFFLIIFMMMCIL